MLTSRYLSNTPGCGEVGKSLLRLHLLSADIGGAGETCGLFIHPREFHMRAMKMLEQIQVGNERLLRRPYVSELPRAVLLNW